MSINFPNSIDVLSNPTGTDLLENATAALDHDVQHSNANDAIEALEAKVGANSSAVTTSHDYKLSGVTGSDKAVSKTGTETLTNKTLTAPQINFGSDANGDLPYRNGSGVTSRLAIGSTDQILAVVAGLPAWIANPSATAATYSTAGVATLDADVRYYAADAGANDTYVITLSPVPSAYTAGMKISFKANTANTGAATINVNSLGAKTIVKYVNTTLADGDIAAGQLCTLIYDGTNFVLQSPISNVAPAISVISAPARSLATNYQNTSGKNMFVMATMKVTRGTVATANNYGRATAYMDTTTTPTTVVGWVECIQPVTGAQNEDAQAQTMMLTFVVPANSYYRVDSTSTGSGAGATIEEWTEQTL